MGKRHSKSELPKARVDLAQSELQKLRAENYTPQGGGYPAQSKTLGTAMKRAQTPAKTQNCAKVLTLLKAYGAA